MGKLQNQRGFTIIELMITVTIAAIVMAIAIPSFRTVAQSSQQRNAVADLSTTLARARTDAAARRRSITICASSDQTTCSGAVTWETGWIIFVDTDGDGTLDAAEETLVVHPAFPSEVTIRMIPSNATRVTYNRDGLLANPVTFRYCDDRGLPSLRAIIVGETGSIRYVTDGKDHSDTAISTCI